ncbi:Alpha/Beta hydrolase protein [Mycena olivaceomarginata]|nr:Alpha/Beta hydrolase protein [Mycena olivaceomarginata]
MWSLFKVGILALLLETRAAVGAALAAPTVTLDSGTFTGTAGTNTHSFLGIPFAQPPVGDLRFRLPVAVSAYTGTHNATAFGPACPQQTIQLPILTGLPQEVVDDVVNSISGPSSPPPRIWIFGGGFEIGSPSMYDGTTIVQRSIAMGEPVIYVSMNHRLAAFGFLASKEVRAAGVGNLGLQDQRQALRWIQKYITAFGGDPTKVTIWGESSGAISVSLQMLANGGDMEGLFRAAFMQSGSPGPSAPYIEKGQKYYDQIVAQTGCSGASDTLACLRTVPFANLKAAQDATPFIFSYQSLVLTWLPRADGTFLSDNPQRLVQQGNVANVPFVTGDCDDEGTLFALSTLNITTDDQFINYIRTLWVPEATTAQGNTLNTLYPSDQIDGSPFDTVLGFGVCFQPSLRPRNFQGDAVFQAPRRFFQQTLSGKQNQWAFLSKREKAVPFLGSVSHIALLINFATNLNPNGKTVPNWPAYTTATPNMMTFLDGPFLTTITQDTYRAAGMQFLTNLTLQLSV